MAIKCKDCIFCEKDDISSTRSAYRVDDDIRYWCKLHNEMVYSYDSCKDGE